MDISLGVVASLIDIQDIQLINKRENNFFESHQLLKNSSIHQMQRVSEEKGFFRRSHAKKKTIDSHKLLF